MQTAVSWLEQEFIKLEATIGIHGVMYQLIENAKEMERQQRILDYTTGYNDASCNHINDAEQYIDQTSRNL